MIAKTGLLLALLMLLCSCSARFVAQEQMTGAADNAGRYTLTQDKAPEVSLSAEEVSVPTPRLEPLSKHGNKSPYRVNGKSYRVLKSAQGYRERGLASWYGAKFHGHTTSNGEIFDMNKISAAHKTLPLPTWVRVTNLANGKMINVRVNDRGPFHPGRVIDLSYAAAVKLDFQDQGTAKVLVEALSTEDLDKATYYVQIAALKNKNSAIALRKQLQNETGERVAIYRDGDFYRLRVGPVRYNQALALRSQFAGDAFGMPMLVLKP